jgi:hypothetical protein
MDQRVATTEANRLHMMAMAEGRRHQMHTVEMYHQFPQLQEVNMLHTIPMMHDQVFQELKARHRYQDWRMKGLLAKLLRWMRQQEALPQHQKASVSLVS